MLRRPLRKIMKNELCDSYDKWHDSMTSGQAAGWACWVGSMLNPMTSSEPIFFDPLENIVLVFLWHLCRHIVVFLLGCGTRVDDVNNGVLATRYHVVSHFS